ncbi:MAG: hypothetical protein RJB66_1325 [Pseudomonadota bacterium]|jgi:endonuclease/exonuclease/phosphatase family metal-dependent hydrolase
MKIKIFLPCLLFGFLFLDVTTWAANKKIFVGTYNVHNLENKDGLNSDLAALKFVDIMGFQEVMFNGTEVMGDFSKILSQKNQYFVAAPVSIKDIDQNIWEGHAISSKYPIERAGLIPLDPAHHQKRAALYAVIKVGETRLLFVNTDHDIDPLQIGYWDRSKNVSSLIKGVERLEFNGPQIIVGDFNTADSYQNWIHGISGQGEVKLTQNDFLANGWVTPRPYPSHPYTFSSFGLRQQLDHIFLKDVLQSSRWQRFDVRRGSDHYPIYAEIKL